MVGYNVHKELIKDTPVTLVKTRFRTKERDRDKAHINTVY